MVNPMTTGGICKDIHVFVHNTLTTISTDEVFLQDFLEILNSQFQGILEVMFPGYHMHNVTCPISKSSTIQWCVTRHERVQTHSLYLLMDISF